MPPALPGDGYLWIHPDECVVMQAAAPTRIMVESTTIPGVVVIQAGDTAAMAQRSDLTCR